MRPHNSGIPKNKVGRSGLVYAKLMGRITESSLMEEAINVRYCFMMMLAIADPKGYVVGTDVAIARRINMPLEEFRECVKILMQPDLDSNSKEQEGRRVIESDCERGYFLVNYAKYRDTRDEEERREYMKEYMRKYRGGSDVAPVNSCKLSKPKKEEAGEVKAKEPPAKQPAALVMPENLKGEEFEKAWHEWIQYRKAAKYKPYVAIGAQKLLVELSAMGMARAVTAINHSIAQGWQGIHEPKVNGYQKPPLEDGMFSRR